MHKALACL